MRHLFKRGAEAQLYCKVPSQCSFNTDKNLKPFQNLKPNSVIEIEGKNKMAQKSNVESVSKKQQPWNLMI